MNEPQSMVAGVVDVPGVVGGVGVAVVVPGFGKLTLVAPRGAIGDMKSFTVGTSVGLTAFQAVMSAGVIGSEAFHGIVCELDALAIFFQSVLAMAANCASLKTCVA